MKTKGKPNKKTDRNNKDQQKQFLRQIIIWMLGIFIVMQLVSIFSGGMHSKETLSYGKFFSMLDSNKENPQIYSVEKIGDKLQGQFYPVNGDKWFQVYIPEDDKQLIELLKTNVEEFKITPTQTFWTSLLYSFAPIL